MKKLPGKFELLTCAALAMGANACATGETRPAPQPEPTKVAEVEPAPETEPDPEFSFDFEDDEKPFFVDDGPPVRAATDPWRWRGPTPLRSTADLSPEQAAAKPARGTEVRIRSKDKGTARVTDRFGATTEVAVPGTFRAVGPVRVRVDFAADDFFEQVVILPESAPGKAVTVTIPPEKSGALIAGTRRIPVSRGVRVVTYEDDKRWDPRPLVEEVVATVGWPPFGNRYVRPGEVGADIRQVVFHTTLTPTAEMAYRNLLGRGFSTHVIIERDGTIIQMVDLDLSAYHAGEANNHSVGIEMVGRMQNLAREPRDGACFAYSREAFAKLPEKSKVEWRKRYIDEIRAEIRYLNECDADAPVGDCGDSESDIEEYIRDTYGPERRLEGCLFPAADLARANPASKNPDLVLPLSPKTRINGAEVQAYGPSPAAMRSVVAVTGALLDAYPAIPKTIPTRETGEIYPNIVADPGEWGLVGHYHWEAQRWDPGPGFDWQALADMLLLRQPAR